MKKVILIASLLVLASCKKEEVTPVNVPAPVVDCKCGLIYLVDWVYNPGTQSQGANLYIKNNCSGNTIIFSKSFNIYSELAGDTTCLGFEW
jgi:hypothetical protein